MSCLDLYDFILNITMDPDSLVPDTGVVMVVLTVSTV